MKPAFATPKEQAALKLVVASWMDTPFIDHGSIKGVGVDCIHFGAQVMVEAGVIPSYEFPAYSLDGGGHRPNSLLIEWLTAHPLFEDRKREADLQPGDILCFLSGRVGHHLGIALGGHRFAHAVIGRKVMTGSLTDPTYGKRLVTVFRPMKGE